MPYLNDTEKAKQSRERQEKRFAKKRDKVEREELKMFSGVITRKPRTITIKKKVKNSRVGFVFNPKLTYPYSPGMGPEFYSTQEWRSLRFKVLRENGRKCAFCGATTENSGLTIHVDHIRPRSKFPTLELVKNNLQVLCSDCNLGKGAD